MKWNSIQTKVLAALVACLVLGVGGILALMQYSFARNSQALALDSVSGSQKLFAILENREISKMIAVSDGLIMNVQIRDAFAAKDRPRLLALSAPTPLLQGTSWPRPASRNESSARSTIRKARLPAMSSLEKNSASSFTP